MHRDFKTSNILVDAKWNGVVADFGLARRMKTRGGAVHEPLPPECTVVMGTFGYVAPEYARTGALTQRHPVSSTQQVAANSQSMTCQLAPRGPHATQAKPTGTQASAGASMHACAGTLNEKSDVYAFGVVLLELLTGAEVVDPQRPLANRNLVDWLYSKLHDIAQVKEVGAAPSRDTDPQRPVCKTVLDQFAQSPNVCAAVWHGRCQCSVV